MSFITIALITLIAAVAFYLAFLLFGVGGIDRNRKAQGLDQKTKN
tara:strand:+ start:394 stop:528 length:135 start_codon:yes stop_codon:yes gene_type:complete